MWKLHKVDLNMYQEINIIVNVQQLLDPRNSGKKIKPFFIKSARSWAYDGAMNSVHVPFQDCFNLTYFMPCSEPIETRLQWEVTAVQLTWNQFSSV